MPMSLTESRVGNQLNEKYTKKPENNSEPESGTTKK